MSLVKDIQEVHVVTGSISNVGTPGAPAYSTHEEVTLSAPQETLGTPSVSGVDITGTDTSTSGRLIRVATSAEITVMRNGLFGNELGSVQFYKLGQLQKYFTEYGVPIFILPEGQFSDVANVYISMWWFSFGPAFGTFIGYNPSNPPRQYVKLKMNTLGVILPELEG